MAGQPHQTTTRTESKPDPPRRNKAAIRTTQPSQPTQGFKYDCVLCNDKHPLYLCTKFNGMSLEQRRTHIRNHNLCYNRLAAGHRTTDCRSISRCKQCSGRHHTMIYRDTTLQSQPSSTQVLANTVTSSLTPAVPHSLMMTSQVVLEGPRGHRLVARTLLDSGATMSLISSKAAQCLQLPRTNTHITFSGV